MTSPALIYARFSTPTQEKGDSLDRQLGDCRDFCKKHHLTVVDEIADMGRSAYKGDHLSIGNLGKLTQRIMSGEIERGTTIVVEKWDRLSRQPPRVVQRWIEDVCDKGIRIAIRSPERWIDLAYLDSENNLIALMDMLMSSHASNIFSKNLSDRINSSWGTKRKKAREQGTPLTSMLPAWLKLNKETGKIEPIPERVALLERIFHATAEGISAWNLANLFNGEGIEPWSSPRKQRAAKVRGWNNTYIRSIVLSPAIEGDHHLTKKIGNSTTKTGEVLIGFFPRVISADLVERARSTVQKRGHTSNGRFAPYARNLFAQIAKCDECGSNMILTGRGLNHEKESYLQCDAAKRRKGCSNRSCFNYEVLEKAILDQMLHIALDDRFFQSDNQRLSDLADQVALRQKEFNDANALRKGYQDLAALRPGDERLRADWIAASDEVDHIDARLKEAQDALATARGATSPEEHRARVIAVSNALGSDDPEVMTNARRRVQASLREVLTQMRCKAVPVAGQKKPQKLTQVALREGLVGIVINNSGEVTGWDFRHKPDHIKGLTASKMAYNAKPVAEVIQRGFG